MLKTPAPFPFPGSTGFRRRDAQPVKILQVCVDGSALVTLLPRPGEVPNRDADGNCRVDFADLFETRTAALRAPAHKPRRQRARQLA